LFGKTLHMLTAYCEKSVEKILSHETGYYMHAIIKVTEKGKNG
jgi:hypothetical protein